MSAMTADKSDIVDKLRARKGGGELLISVMREAANEIEQLREALIEARICILNYGDPKYAEKRALALLKIDQIASSIPMPRRADMTEDQYLDIMRPLRDALKVTTDPMTDTEIRRALFWLDLCEIEPNEECEKCPIEPEQQPDLR